MILDSLGDFEDVPPWSEIADQFFEAGLMLNPSELHGGIAGLIGAGMKVGDDTFLPALERSLNANFHGELVDNVERLSKATISALRDADYAFYPLLPEDDEDFEERLICLSRWATGFLTGYTQGVSVQKTGEQGLPPETAEALKDFAAIAQVDLEERETDDAERDLDEIVEYMRVAAMNVIHNMLAEEE